MSHGVRFFYGITKPTRHFQTFKKETRERGFIWRFIVLLAVSSIVWAVTAVLNVQFAGTLPEYSYLSEGNQTNVLLTEFITGGITGIIIPLIAIAVGAILYWPFFQEVGFKKLFVLHTYTYVVFLIAACLQLPFIAALHVPNDYSPFSLGVLADLITNQSFILSFLYSITIFLGWIWIVQFFALKNAAKRSNVYTVLSIVGLTLAALLVYAGFQAL
ncbi:hypothetical protein [Pseudalkalibacillus caeni]|uniref:Yip1 domain-containing protein n=1 Tax=Exobacillus caeni TaxID=2574798 RepID=A0A5R9F6A3_9BACL|nr:hypothetical protein [Pseudalkalibacillus caeni]TLS37876.1 hypothetical protein FCL54_08645 [Pseudalkalibacillus caeni]